MRKLLSLPTFILALLLTTTAYSSTAVVVGFFSPSELHDIEVSCQNSDIKSITLIPEHTTSNCNPRLHIKNVALSYESGFNQYFEYPDDGHIEGSPLTRSTFTVLPGTRCLSGLSVNVNQAHGDDCDTKVQVVINR